MPVIRFAITGIFFALVSLYRVLIFPFLSLILKLDNFKGTSKKFSF